MLVDDFDAVRAPSRGGGREGTGAVWGCCCGGSAPGATWPATMVERLIAALRERSARRPRHVVRGRAVRTSGTSQRAAWRAVRARAPLIERHGLPFPQDHRSARPAAWRRRHHHPGHDVHNDDYLEPVQSIRPFLARSAGARLTRRRRAGRAVGQDDEQRLAETRRIPCIGTRRRLARAVHRTEPGHHRCRNRGRGCRCSRRTRVAAVAGRRRARSSGSGEAIGGA